MSIEWQELLIPKVSFVELMVRGTVMYLMLFALLRFLVRRHIGAMNLTDLLVLVLIADAAQNAMASEYRSLPEGIVLCATIIGLSVAIDALAFRFKWIRRLVEPSPLPLVREGKIQRRNLRAELITIDELMSHLRQQGIEDAREVKLAHIEPDGQVSIIKNKTSHSDEGESPKRKRAGVA